MPLNHSELLQGLLSVLEHQARSDKREPKDVLREGVLDLPEGVLHVAKVNVHLHVYRRYVLTDLENYLLGLVVVDLELEEVNPVGVGRQSTEEI